ncbi:ATP-binding protein [Sphingomonas sp. HF-S3]|uniref:histidine kinase n=1 Tax=Sphingomonas rustica TaxID=3103142 RepID=A0ABV0BA60_9SPHN
MGSDFTVQLALRLLLVQLLLAAQAWAMLTPGLAAVRIVLLLLVVGAGWLLWRHVQRTNHQVARFVEALRHGDGSAHFSGRSGSGFDAMGRAFDDAMRALRDERRAAGDQLNFLGALVDDTPIPLLTVDADGRIDLANKAARRLFTEHEAFTQEGFRIYGATFANRLDIAAPLREEVLILTLQGRASRAIVRSAALARLGNNIHVVIVQPVQETLNAIEMTAQTDLVRVLTHEILNSLTPVTSLAATASTLIAQVDDPRLEDARLAVATLERRAEGLARFINSYRQVASEPVLDRRPFQAAPFAAELARLFRAERPDVALDLLLDPSDFAIDADPDLLAQALINLLRNAGEAASGHAASPRVLFDLRRSSAGEIGIAVADNGPGVPPELRRDIFLPFFTTRATGTGVGLNLVRQIVFAHGGTIDLKDDALGGARFEILL